VIKYKINGEIVTKEEWDARKGCGLRQGEAPMGTVAYSEDSPWLGDGPGYLPNQVQEARQKVEKAKRDGRLRGINILDDGRVRITSRQGRAEFLHFRGLHDNDGGYGDG